MIMKKFILLIALLASLNTLYANDIHWITFVDTTDESVGETDKNTRQILYSRWINIINSALLPRGYNAQVHDYAGLRTSPENCKDIVENLRCNSEDIIVFYYIGHGARATSDKSKYPQMALAQHFENKCIPLEWVHKELKKKNARLVITIGMCCNSYAEGLSAKEKVAFSVNHGHSYVAMDAVSNIQQLFLENKGDIIISSSDKGQASWGGYIQGVGLIDCFSYTLMNIFNREVGKTYKADWESIFTDVQTIVNNETLAASRQPGSRVTQQTPIFDVNLDEASMPEITPVKPEPPTPPSPDTKDVNEVIKNNVAQALDGIISSELTREQRENLAKALQSKYFSSNAIVRILGQDVDVVIDKQSASDYFGNISFITRSKPIKIAVVDCELDAFKKIKSLVVREIYKK